MTPRQSIFISANTRELKSPRQLVANTLQFLGYEPLWQDIFNTEQGDLRAMLRRKIDGCKGVVQIVGMRYGAEPSTPDAEFGRVSYTQYEALYARKRGKKVWYLLLDERFPLEKLDPEPGELRALQLAYRARLQADSHLFHPISTPEAVEADVLKLRDDLSRLRRNARQWAAAVTALLVAIAGLTVWSLMRQQRIDRMGTENNARMAMVVAGIADVRADLAKARLSQPGPAGAGDGEDMYPVLAAKFGVDAKTLRDELPRFAAELQKSPSASRLDRASAAYVVRDYAGAIRWALQAAEDAAQAVPPRPEEALRAYQLATWAAVDSADYDRALAYLRAAEKSVDRQANPEAWARIQSGLCYVLYRMDRFAEAEVVIREGVRDSARRLGPDTVETLCGRNNLAAVLSKLGRHDDAVKEYRDVLAIRERMLGTNDPETVLSRGNLAAELSDSGRLEEALIQGSAVVAVREQYLGADHRETLRAREMLAVTLQRVGKAEDAEREMRAVLALRVKKFGADDPDTLASRSDLATVLDSLGRHAEAERELRDVVAGMDSRHGPDAYLTSVSRVNLACALVGQGKYAEAERLFRRVLSVQSQSLGPANPDTVATRTKLRQVLIAQSKFDVLEDDLRALLAERKSRSGGTVAAEDVTTTELLAFAVFSQGRFAEAVALEEQGLAMLNEIGSDDARNAVAGVSLTLARYRLFARDFAGALAAAETGLGRAPQDLRLLARKAVALHYAGRQPEALELCRQNLGKTWDGPGKRSWEQMVRRDLDELEKAGITNPATPALREALAGGSH